MATGRSTCRDTWQSSVGFQKQINPVTGFDVDLTHWTEYRDTRTIDANLAYNPATGYNLANGTAPVRPNPAYAGVYEFVSDGVAEVFNLFNHGNFGSYNVSLSATAPATTALFGTPNRNTGTAYVPRQGQLGFKVSF